MLPEEVTFGAALPLVPAALSLALDATVLVPGAGFTGGGFVGMAATGGSFVGMAATGGGFVGMSATRGGFVGMATTGDGFVGMAATGGSFVGMVATGGGFVGMVATGMVAILWPRGSLVRVNFSSVWPSGCFTK